MNKFNFFTSPAVLERTLYVAALIFILLSVATLWACLGVESHKMLYANERKCIQSKQTDPECKVTFSVE